MNQGFTDLDLSRLYLDATAKDLQSAIGAYVRPTFSELVNKGGYIFSLQTIPTALEDETGRGIDLVYLLEETPSLQALSLYLPLHICQYLTMQKSYPETTVSLPDTKLRIAEFPDTGEKISHNTRYIPYASMSRSFPGKAAVQAVDAAYYFMLAELERLAYCESIEDYAACHTGAAIEEGVRLYVQKHRKPNAAAVSKAARRNAGKRPPPPAAQHIRGVACPAGVYQR